MRRWAILAALVDGMNKHGSWCGETHIQKCTYFLQDLLSVPTGFEFILYKHGPFSFELRDELGDMSAHFLLKAEARQYPYGPSWRTEASAEVLKRQFSKTLGKYAVHIHFAASELSVKSVAELERLATALFVTKKHEGAVEEMADFIHKLKPHVSVTQALQALEEVAILRKRASSVLLPGDGVGSRAQRMIIDSPVRT